MPRLFLPSCLLSLAAIAFVACDDETASPQNTPVSTSVVTAAPTSDGNVSPSPTALVSLVTPEPIEAQFGRVPISEPSMSTTNVPLILAETGSPDVSAGSTFDRMTFQFDGDHPAYDIQYVSGPAQNCASGQDENITGVAFLEISFTPAVAHDEQGVQTVSPTDLQSGLPSIQQAKQVCDFEGVVTWMLGLSAEADFRAFTLLDQILVVDIAHP
jgi:hypothetical protein